MHPNRLYVCETVAAWQAIWIWIKNEISPGQESAMSILSDGEMAGSYSVTATQTRCRWSAADKLIKLSEVKHSCLQRISWYSFFLWQNISQCGTAVRIASKNYYSHKLKCATTLNGIDAMHNMPPSVIPSITWYKYCSCRFPIPAISFAISLLLLLYVTQYAFLVQQIQIAKKYYTLYAAWWTYHRNKLLNNLI